MQAQRVRLQRYNGLIHCIVLIINMSGRQTPTQEHKTIQRTNLKVFQNLYLKILKVKI